MGRIKSLMIKRAAKQLLDGEHAFTDKFEHNKKLLANSMPSKSTRNKIAGYIARLIIIKEKEKTMPPKPKMDETGTPVKERYNKYQYS